MSEDLFGYSIEDFQEEAREILDRADDILGRLQADPSNIEEVNALFRAIHSVKGSSAYVGQPNVNTFSHHYESLLGDLRRKKETITEDAMKVLVRSRDYLEDLVFSPDTTEMVEIDETIEDSLERISTALKLKSATTGGGEPSQVPSVETSQPQSEVPQPQSEVPQPQSEVPQPQTEVPQPQTEVAQPPVQREAAQPPQPEAQPSQELLNAVGIGGVEETGNTGAPSLEAKENKDDALPDITGVNPAEMDQSDVIKLTVTAQLKSLHEFLEAAEPEKDKIKKLLFKLEETVTWAFGDEAVNIIVPVEEMQLLLAGPLPLEAGDMKKLKQGYMMLIPAVKKEFAILDGEDLITTSVSAATSAPKSVDDLRSPSLASPVDSEEATKIRGASREEIVILTASKNVESLVRLLEEESPDTGQLVRLLQRLWDLNQWAFEDNEEIRLSITTMRDLIAHSDEPEVLKELKMRGSVVKSLFKPFIEYRQEELEREIEPEPLFIGVDTSVAAPALKVPGTKVGIATEDTRQVPEAPLEGAPLATSFTTNETPQVERRRGLNKGPQGTVKKAVAGPVSTLKVRTDDLESLITTVGGIRGIDDKDLELLQSATLQLRMIPVGELFGRFRKIVRDLSEELEKAIGIEISGESVKLDKMIADKLSEPLLHMVRNAASHGVETVEERAALGKGKAVIRLNAYQEGGQVIIEVSDNGRGMSVEKIKKRVLDMELATSEELEGATDKKILDYIFAPGFSTKEAADKVSGRGVGMDVVKNAIGALQGSVSIDTKEGVGTVIRLQLPLTLAIIRGMVLEQSGNKIAVPAGSVDRVMNMTQAELEEGSFLDKNRLSLYLAEEGEILPLVNFSQLFGLEADSTKRCVVLLKVGGGHKIALVVDSAVGRQPLTVKPLDKFSETRFFSSASLVDGEVIFILNIPSLQAA